MPPPRCSSAAARPKIRRRRRPHLPLRHPGPRPAQRAARRHGQNALPQHRRLVRCRSGRIAQRSRARPPGFAHLFEHMMFRGTERFSPDQWNQIMQRAGAETNAYTTDDRTVYHAVFSKEDLEPIVDLEADRFQNLKYSEEIFRTETRAVLSEYNKSFSDPMRKLDEQLRNRAFTTHTYKHTTMGFIEDVEAMPEMYDYGLEFFHRYYRPEYTVVSIVGDIEHEQAQKLIEEYWGGWPPDCDHFSSLIPSLLIRVPIELVDC
ncbi:MAG: pitrilysin family protein [Bryobacterales bacterium]